MSSEEVVGHIYKHVGNIERVNGVELVCLDPDTDLTIIQAEAVRFINNILLFRPIDCHQYALEALGATVQHKSQKTLTVIPVSSRSKN